MIPATIQDLAAPRPTAHGEVLPQEIRVGQMLLAQTMIALSKRLDTLLAAQEAADPAPPRSGIDILKKAIERAERPAKAPKVRALQAAPAATPPPAPAPVEPPAPAPTPKAAPVASTVTVPANVSRLSHQAYVDGYAAGLVGEASDANPFQGATRGINGGRRLAWDRGFDDARPA